jgi:membrane protein
MRGVAGSGHPLGAVHPWQHLGRLWAWLRDAGGILVHALRRFDGDNGYQIASALTYTALLSLVPLLTVTFGIFSAFPAFDRVRQEAQATVIHSLVPEVGDAVLEYTNAFMSNAAALTGFGVIFLAITSIILFNTIEGAMNSIWRAAEPRPIVVRLLSFWATLTMTPLLLGASLSAAHGFLGATGDRPLLPALRLALPALIELLGFTLLYSVLPNRTVQWRDSAIGALAATALLEASKWGFGVYINAFPTYQTIYGALSVVPIFLFWMYLLWLIILFGAELAAALPEWRAGQLTRSGPEGLLAGQRLVVALAIMRELRAASRLGVGMRRATLVARIPVGAVIVDGMLERLRAAHWVARTANGAWVASRDLAGATLYDLQRSLGAGLRGNLRTLGTLSAPWQERLADLVEHAEAADSEIMGVSIARLLDEPEAVPVPAKRERD